MSAIDKIARLYSLAKERAQGTGTLYSKALGTSHCPCGVANNLFVVQPPQK